MSSLLSVRDLSVTMPDGTQALDHVSFTVDRGEIVGFIGESGSGKSTTANAIARLLPQGSQTTGVIEYNGEDVSAYTPRQLTTFRSRDLGIVFQDPRAAINPVARVGEYVTESLRVDRRMPRAAARSRAEELFHEVGIPNPSTRLDEYPHQFSGGMLQRAVIAAALSTDPKLVLADEATTALDVTRQAEIAAILQTACKERDLGLMFITHDLELAGALCDKICVMYCGRIVEEIAAEHLHSQAQHPYTIALLRSRPSVSARAQRLPVITAADRDGFTQTQNGAAYA